jgi:hypothetical protein
LRRKRGPGQGAQRCVTFFFSLADESATAYLSHQILASHPRLSRRMATLSAASEEILASLVGDTLCTQDADRDALSRCNDFAAS